MFLRLCQVVASVRMYTVSDWLRKTCTNLYSCMDISENDHGLIDLLMALYYTPWGAYEKV